MRWFALLTLVFVVGCSPVPQPDSIKTVAAFDVPLLTEADRSQFLGLLARLAQEEGMHLDFADAAELDAISRVSGHRRMMHAAVYGDANDRELIASTMDWPERPGNIWLMFSQGEDVARAKRYREAAMREIRTRWPDTLNLPIAETGAIPNFEDLMRTPDGYIVRPSEAWKYTHEPKRPSDDNRPSGQP